TVTLVLYDASTRLPTVGTGIEGVVAGRDGPVDDKNEANFAALFISKPGRYILRARAEFGALVVFDENQVIEVTDGPSGALLRSSLQTQAAAPGAPAFDRDPHLVNVGLGSYIQNFDNYATLPAYNTGLYPNNDLPSLDPSAGLGPIPVQPNVT